METVLIETYKKKCIPASAHLKWYQTEPEDYVEIGNCEPGKLR